METALNEITLVLFTTIAPAGLVGYAVMALYTVTVRDRTRAEAASRYLVVPLVLVITGLIASATHLGTPANALYVLSGVGRSPLANEVVAVVAFLVAGGAWWMVSFRDDVSERLRRVAVTVVLVAAVVALYFISVAYSIPWVPTWALPTVPVTLWLGALVSGVPVGLFGLAAAGQTPGARFTALALLAGAAAPVGNAVVLGIQWADLASIETTLVAAPDLVPWTPAVIAAFAVLATAALGACAWAEQHRGPHRAFVEGSCVLAVLVACFLVRFTFYAMRMTAGV